MARPAEAKCLFCGTFFRADPRNARHRKYCSAAACRKASEAASRRAWLAKSENQDYFRGPENAARVQLWRASHPGYWRHPHLVMRREPRVAPAEHAATKLVSERLIFHEKIERRAPKALGKQSLRRER